MRTVAGPSSAVQCELTGGPYTVWSPCAACPGGVPAAMPEAELVADQDLIRAERVPVRTSRRWVCDPLPGRRLHQLAQHILKPTTEHPAAAAGLGPPNSNTGSSVLVCIGRHRMIIGYGACHRR